MTFKIRLNSRNAFLKYCKIVITCLLSLNNILNIIYIQLCKWKQSVTYIIKNTSTYLFQVVYKEWTRLKYINRDFRAISVTVIAYLKKNHLTIINKDIIAPKLCWTKRHFCLKSMPNRTKIWRTFDIAVILNAWLIAWRQVNAYNLI